MPSTYAHKKFSEEVMSMLTGEAREAVLSYPSLYCAGCHGPDLLFYYKGARRNPVNDQGFAMHKESAAPFFERAKELVRKNGQAALSYAAGFITHFALDSECHGYVEAKRKELKISHTKLEVEFDRFLLVCCGYDPVSTRLAEHIRPRREDAAVIAGFFDRPSEVIERAMRDMRRICNLFVTPGRVRHAVICGILKMLNDELPDQVMGRAPDPRCAESNREMLAQFENAKRVAAALIGDFTNNINSAGLCERFAHDYE